MEEKYNLGGRILLGGVLIRIFHSENGIKLAIEESHKDNIVWLKDQPEAVVFPKEKNNAYAREVDRTPAEKGGTNDVNAKYHELLYEVATKHPGESRHKTALRYIRQAEDRPAHCEAAAPPPEQEEQ